MRIGIMQPYLFPYKGYFDLIRSVDRFVVYDDAQWIKSGWINRNNFPLRFTFPVQKHSSYAKINECYFSDLEQNKKRFMSKTRLAVAYKYLNLMAQNYSVSYNNTLTLQAICKDLGISTPFYLASEIKHGKSVQGVLDMVRALQGTTYINLPGGKSLYNQKDFGDIKLEFIETVQEPSILCSL